MIAELDEQIARLKDGGTLTEKEVEILCERVSSGGCCLNVRPSIRVSFFTHPT